MKRITTTVIRENVDAREAAKLYGLKLNRSDMALCPFHGEKTPSFKVYRDHYYCFGCQESGDVISLAMKLTGLDFAGAMERLAATLTDSGRSSINGRRASGLSWSGRTREPTRTAETSASTWRRLLISTTSTTSASPSGE